MSIKGHNLPPPNLILNIYASHSGIILQRPLRADLTLHSITIIRIDIANSETKSVYNPSPEEGSPRCSRQGNAPRFKIRPIK